MCEDQLLGDDSVLDKIVAERYGSVHISSKELGLYFNRLARRQGWTVQQIQNQVLTSFDVWRWYDQYDAYLGSVLQLRKYCGLD